MKRILLVFLSFTALSSAGQNLKTKEIKQRVSESKVTSVELLTDDTFTPGVKQKLNLVVLFTDGIKVTASDAKVIWEVAEVSLNDSIVTLTKKNFEDGFAVVDPGDPWKFYANPYLVVRVSLGGQKVDKKLSPRFCHDTFIIEERGENGAAGSSNYGSRTNGFDGKNGDEGPEIKLRFTEEVVADKLCLVMQYKDKRFPFDPSCSLLTIVTRGGNGGKGGNGGPGVSTVEGGRGAQGGNGGYGGRGGRIVVTGGDVYGKYARIIILKSEGGIFGKPGMGGRSNGYPLPGRAGQAGLQGQGGPIEILD